MSTVLAAGSAALVVEGGQGVSRVAGALRSFEVMWRKTRNCIMCMNVCVGRGRGGEEGQAGIQGRAVLDFAGF